MSSRWVRSVAILLAVAWSLPGHSVDPDTKFLQYQFGWPDDHQIPYEVLDVVEDTEGYLWLATPRGLMRYDGLRTEIFRIATYPAVLSNRPTRLYVDSRGRVFVASERGLSIYSNGTFNAVVTGRKRSAHIHAIAEDPGGTVWFGSDDGLYRLDGDQVTQVELDIPVENVRSLAWHDGALYVGGRGHVFLLRQNKVTALDLPAEQAGRYVVDLEVHQGKVWGTAREVVFQVQESELSVAQEPELAGLSVDVLLSDRDNNLWLGGEDIIGRFLPDGQLRIPDLTDDVTGIEPQITQFFEDSSGQIWYSSHVIGINFMRDTPIRRFSYSEGLVSPIVTAITEGESSAAIVATDNGLAIVGVDGIENLDDVELQSDLISSMKVHERLLHVGTESGYDALDLETHRWLNINSKAIDSPINALDIDSTGVVWLASDAGLFRYSPSDPGPLIVVDNMAIESLLIDEADQIWLGTETGPARLEGRTIVPVATESMPAASSAIVAIIPVPDDGIVAATRDQGLLLRRNGLWRRFSEADGLPPEQLIDVEYKNGDLWLVTSGGLFRMPLPRDDDSLVPPQAVVAASHYRPMHAGNCCRGINSASAMVLADQLHVATDDGMLIVGDASTEQRATAPRAYISRFHAGDTQYSLDSNAIELDADSRSIEIEFSAIQLAFGNQVRFRYRLLGLHKDWVDAGEKRSVRFDNLAPGEYVFEVQASMQPGVWTASTVALGIQRVPAFLETVFFRLLVWIAAVAAAFGVIAWRLVSLRNRRIALETEIGERTDALQELNCELQHANDELERSTQTDPLTGLFNRRFFDVSANKHELSDRVADSGVLAFVDIDFFKRVNDSYGHSAGDEILCQFASVLRSAMRQSDLVARWGGEEFILFGRCPSGDPPALLNRVMDAVRSHPFRLPNDQLVEISCSIGAIRYPLWSGDSIDDRLPVLLEMADSALYAVKTHGRDGWALLAGGNEPESGLSEYQATGSDRQIKRLVDQGVLSWTTSREGIGLSLFDTVTRLNVLKYGSQ